MKQRLIPFIAFLLASAPIRSLASTSIYIPNLGTGQTGTKVGSKQSADVYVAGGALTFTEQATAADGAAAPAVGKMAMGVDGSGNSQYLSADTSGNLNTNRTWALSSGTDSCSAVESGTWNITNVSGTVSLPTGAATGAKQDTGNTSLSSIDGKLHALGQNTMASSMPVTIASDQVAPKTYANSAGSFVLNASLTTVVTESPPANAVGFVLEAKDSNAANIRWAVGATATTTSGMQLQPGRDTGFVPVAASISIVAESGTLEYQLTWVKQ